MKQHTSNFKNALPQLGRQFKSQIIYNNTTYESELYSVTPMFQSNILKSVMKQLTVEIKADIPVGSTIKYKLGLLVNGQYEYIDYGDYTVLYSKKKEDTDMFELTCYDKMLFTMIMYQGIDVEFPMTVRDYIGAICNKLNMTFANSSDTFVNYNKIINTDLYMNIGYTYRDVLDDLAEVTASTICINQNNQLEIRYISNNPVDTIDENFLKDVNVNFGEKFGKVNSIVLSRSAESDNVYLQDEESVEENGLCEIKIIDNQIMNFNDRATYLPDILDKLDGLEYYINDYTSTGILYLDVCDRYNVQIGENIYSCIMFNDEIDVTLGVQELVHTDMPEQAETDYMKADKTDQKINQTYLIVDKQNQQIQSLISQIGDRSQKTTSITQDIDVIESKVDNMADFTRETTSLNEVHLEETAEGNNFVIDLNIKGNTAIWKYLTPEIDLTPSNSLVPLGDSIVIISDTQSRNNPSINAVEHKIKVSEPLRNYSNIYDELNIHNGVVTITRRLGERNGEVYILDNPTTEVLEEKVKLTTFDDNTYIYIREYEQLNYYCKYVIDSDYTEFFASQDNLENAVVELNSSITQTAEEINLEVSKKVGNDEVISRINQSAEQVTIDAGKININGTVSANGNFIVDTQGNMTCNNAKITGGKTIIYGGTEQNANLLVGKNVPIIYNDTCTSIIPSGINIQSFTSEITGIGISSGPASQAGGQIIMNCYPSYSTLTMGSSQTGNVFSVSTNSNECKLYGTYIGQAYNYISLEKYKKNINKFNEKMLEKIKNSDIYTFNYNNEKDTDKKHIGFVIGEKYKTPIEVIANNNEGIDSYSMCAILWKAVQEQQEIIEQLQKEIKEVKNGQD